MGGAIIHASLSFGPISAWLDASLDALVNFHPLHYIADFSVSIGVTFDIDVWFIHIHISASVGAWLHIEGPELGGNAQSVFSCPWNWVCRLIVMAVSLSTLTCLVSLLILVQQSKLPLPSTSCNSGKCSTHPALHPLLPIQAQIQILHEDT